MKKESIKDIFNLNKLEEFKEITSNIPQDDMEDIVVIDQNEIETEASRKASDIISKLSKIFISPDLLQRQPFIASKIESNIDTLRRLLKMLASDEKVHDILITNLSKNNNNASLYLSLVKIQSSIIEIQTQIDKTLNSLQTSLKNIQLELNIDTGEEQHTEETVGATRGTKDFIKKLQIENEK